MKAWRLRAWFKPTTITVNNANTNYTITSSAGNFIGGNASLTKSSGGTLTLVGGVNTNTGVTTVSGGILRSARWPTAGG